VRKDEFSVEGGEEGGDSRVDIQATREWTSRPLFPSGNLKSFTQNEEKVRDFPHLLLSTTKNLLPSLPPSLLPPSLPPSLPLSLLPVIKPPEA